MEKFTEKAGKSGEVFRRHRAGLEHHQTAIVQQIAQRGAKLVSERLSVEFKSGNERADRRLYLRDAHVARAWRIQKQA